MPTSAFLLQATLADAVQRLLERVRPLTLPIDVDQLWRAQGIRSVTPREMDESARLVGGRSFRIYFNPKHGERRTRFSICHEIAHTFFVDEERRLESGLAVRANLETCPSLETEETLCDWAAGELLMPRAPFVEAVTKAPPGMLRLQELSRLFGVSQPAVLRRIESLSLRWPCVVLRWTPVNGHGAIDKFKLRSQWSISGFQKPFGIGFEACIDGLFKTHHTGRLAVDHVGGCRLESYRRHDASGVVEVESLLTLQQ